MPSADSPDTSSRRVLRIHGIYFPSQDRSDDEGALLVTQYSFLHLSPISSLENGPHGTFDDREVYLEFKDFDSMGYRQDASLIAIQKIAEVKNIELQHSVDIPNGEYFPSAH